MTRGAGLAALAMLAACSTAGSTWMAQPLADDAFPTAASSAGGKASSTRSSGTMLRSTHTLSEERSAKGAKNLSDEPLRPVRQLGGKLEGKILGKFRNTYYDFPSEADHKGPPVALKSSECQTIKDVPKGFYQALCVQGSGTLAGGQTVSFAKRDCACAAVCEKTNQKICFDALDPKQFPYGRGATGGPITPLFTVAVDSAVIPLGTTIYIPELEGMPRDSESSGLHDGCFIAQDRGLRVQGKHVDVFTGHPSMTRLWNKLVPSNDGVTVVLDSPKCARAGSEAGSAGAPASTKTGDPEPKRERKKNKDRKRGPEN
jgi:3D (Asp-Asp-Asp) domain-containing protein